MSLFYLYLFVLHVEVKYTTLEMYRDLVLTENFLLFVLLFDPNGNCTLNGDKVFDSVIL